ncbi:hypothetical protein V1509DRAFT_414394 [Lipomyces kononenkoae]
MVQTLGKLPEPWWSSWESRHDYFDEDGKPKNYWPNGIPLSKEYPLIQLIRDIGADDYQPVTDEYSVETDNVKSSDCAEPETNSMFESMGTRLSATEVEVFEDLLHKVLRYNPEQRLQIQEIIEHSWFTISSEGSSTVTDPISITASSPAKRRLKDGKFQTIVAVFHQSAAIVFNYVSSMILLSLGILEACLTALKTRLELRMRNLMGLTRYLY